MSFRKPQVPVVVPAYEPDERLPMLLRALQPDGQLRPVIVVNDGSGPASADLFAAVQDMDGVVLLEHPRNRGKGAALKTAFRYCLSSLPACTGVVTADCDGQHTPDDIRAVAEALTGQPDRLILGVRDFNASGIPVRSRMGNRLSRIAFRMARVRVTDTQTGLRGIPRPLMTLLLDVPYDRYEFETYMLIAAVRNGLRFHEQPIRTVYLNHNQGSHFSPWRDSFRIYRVLLGNTASQMKRFAVSSLVSAVLDLSLFSLLYHRLLPMLGVPRLIGATVLARVMSAIFNYLVNRRYVFRQAGRRNRRSMLRYSVLCLLLAGASYVVMRGLLPWFPGRYATRLKAVVDLVLFLASFTIQKILVFHRLGIPRLASPRSGQPEAGTRPG